jgi:hypothetical protein
MADVVGDIIFAPFFHSFFTAFSSATGGNGVGTRKVVLSGQGERKVIHSLVSTSGND